MADFSLFNTNSWQQAAGKNAYDSKSINDLVASMDSNDTDFGYGAVVITPRTDVWDWFNKDVDPLPVVTGVLMDPLDLNFTSEWESMENVSIPITNSVVEGAYGDVSSKAVVAGGGSPGAVWKSKKLWKKSGDLSLDLKIRVVDWDGTGDPLNNAIRCIRLVVSSGKNDGTYFVAKIGNAYASEVGLVSDIGGAAIGVVTDAVAAVTDPVLENVRVKMANKATPEAKKDTASKYGASGSNLQQNLAEDFDDLTTLRNSPLPCEIRIGKYFHHRDMVIQNVRFNFSKEVSQSGPLYVDITIQAVTRKIISGMEDTGLKKVSGMANGRVQFASTGTTTKPSAVTSMPEPETVITNAGQSTGTKSDVIGDSAKTAEEYGALMGLTPVK